VLTLPYLTFYSSCVALIVSGFCMLPETTFAQRFENQLVQDFENTHLVIQKKQM